jgi:hypothetical protein
LKGILKTMANIITFEMTDSQAKNLETVIDKTLNALIRLEKESPLREAHIAKSQAETKKIKIEIQTQLAILKSRNSA